MEMNPIKYLLCIPHGGLNDMLCQIEMCLKYCKRHDRTLVLDTSFSGLRDDFLKYFTFHDNCKVKVEAWDNIRDTMEGKSTFPEGLQSNLGNYVATNRKGFFYVHPESGQTLTFDFSKPYDQDVLVHESLGGGINSYWLLQYLIPTDWLQEKLKSKLGDLPGDFVAVHIRNTDLATDYRAFMASIDWALKNQAFLLCTDSGVVQNEILNDPRYAGRALVLSSLDPLSQKRLHDEDTTDESANITLFSDFVAMSLAKNVYFTFTQEGRVSGFSGLAFAACASTFADRLASLLGLERPERSWGLRVHGKGMARYFRNQAALITLKKVIRVILFSRERLLKGRILFKISPT